LNPKIKS